MSRFRVIGMSLFFWVMACEDKTPVVQAPPEASTASVQAIASQPAASKSAASSAAEVPKLLPPTLLVDGPGLGTIVGLHDGFVYWTSHSSGDCPSPADCPSGDVRLLRMPREGGVAQEVTGGLDTVSSLSFDKENVLWSMCGLVDHVQRCRLMVSPKEGGKRTVLFDAGPDMISAFTTMADGMVWAEPGKKRLQRLEGKSQKPTQLAETGDITDLFVHGDTVFWTEGRGLTPNGLIKKVQANGTPTVIAKDRRHPRHLTGNDTHLFWVETQESETGTSMQTILAMTHDGTEAKPVIDAVSHIGGVGVAGKHMAFVTTDSLVWASASGGEQRVIASGLTSPHGPELDEKYVYFIAQGKLWRLALP